MICKWLVVSTFGLLIQIKLFNEELSPFITSIRNMKTNYSHHLGQLNKKEMFALLVFSLKSNYIATLLICKLKMKKKHTIGRFTVLSMISSFSSGLAFTSIKCTFENNKIDTKIVLVR